MQTANPENATGWERIECPPDLIVPCQCCEAPPIRVRAYRLAGCGTLELRYKWHACREWMPVGLEYVNAFPGIMVEDEHSRRRVFNYIRHTMQDHIAKQPIAYVETRQRLDTLVLGYKGDKINFSWRPYAERTKAARASYDRLKRSIHRLGMLKPIITYGPHVLIGMRRVEILRDMYTEHQDIDVACWDITEDVSRWWSVDNFKRMPKLKALIGEAEY